MAFSAGPQGGVLDYKHIECRMAPANPVESPFPVAAAAAAAAAEAGAVAAVAVGAPPPPTGEWRYKKYRKSTHNSSFSKNGTAPNSGSYLVGAPLEFASR